MKDGINTVIDGSTALSVGQKQLLCLARVILESKPYLIMDEATANIDQETNEIIKAVVARKFKESTVIAIAHRLDTV
jgi:ABC-type multidrug transport system fused ATPase/permease subunit